MNILRKIILTSFIAVFAVLGLTSIPTATTYAAGGGEVTKGFNAAGGDSKCSGGKCSLKDSIQTITNVLLFILGTIAVIMIIVGGIRYVTSNGDTGQITSAKNTVLYSVIGLVVALMAYAIVNFVIGQFAN